MPKRKDRVICTPQSHTADLAVDGKDGLTYWKQILPESQIQYRDKDGKTRTIDFNAEYHRDCIDSFRNKAVDQTCFQVADKNNAHGRDFDPERQRAEVLDMATYDDLPDDVKAKTGSPGLYAKMRFFSKKAAKAVRQNPSLGVSARVRENFERADGTLVKRAIIHVLGTIDPRVTGMAGWQGADLSYPHGSENVLDLSNESYKGQEMAKGKGATKDRAAHIPTDDEIDKMTDEELDAFLSAGLDDLQASETGTDEDDDAETGAGEQEGERVTASLSTKAKGKRNKDLDLANEQARQANERSNQALKRLAAAEFKSYRSALIAKGVPPERIDLAQPVLERADDMVVDLSNEGGNSDLDVSKIVRELLEGYEGTVDMSNETGHGGQFDASNGEDPDNEVLKAWSDSFGDA